MTFQATATSGTAPYTYAWNPPPSNYNAPNQYTASYANSAPGPSVVIRDSESIVSNTISCPAVTVLAPIGSSNLQIGRTVSTATTNSLTIKQTNAFAVKWNLTVTSDYSCVPSVNPDPNNSNWNTYWKSNSLNPVDNGDGTKTWSGDTSTNLKAGTVAVPITPGIYQLGITCTSSATPTPNPTQSTSATLKINSSSEKEI